MRAISQFQLNQLKLYKDARQMNHNNCANGATSLALEGFSIPVKICDGLFMADRHIAQDAEFFDTNLISHVINCAGQEVPNCRKVVDVAFLTFDWSEQTIQNITEQKVVSVTVNFIEQCRRSSGCLLIHYAASQSRPFCLLACYFMIRYKWSLFKTLKQDVELEPAFFEQLTVFAQKLQEKGLIRSKIWSIMPGMPEDQIILTNTYCNSKNKFTAGVAAQPKRSGGYGQSNRISWKKELVIEHVYCPNSAVSTINENPIKQAEKLVRRNARSASEQSKTSNTANQQTTSNNSMNNTGSMHDNNTVPPANNSNKNRNNSNIEMIASQQLRNSLINAVSHPQQTAGRRDNSRDNKQNSSNIHSQSQSSAEMNVTKKWAELREMWVREKENYQNTNNVANGEKKSTPIIAKKEGQRINDRLQDKLNMLKKHQQRVSAGENSRAQCRSSLQREKKQQSHNHSQKQPSNKQNHPDFSNESQTGRNGSEPPNRKNEQFLNKDSRVVHNNWIIDNHQVMADISNKNANGNNGINCSSEQRGSKSKMNQKSVIIVKPNHGGSSLDNKDSRNGYASGGNVNNSSHQGSRSSLRKVNNSQKKDDKSNTVSQEGGKFFRNEVADIMANKGRSSSTKPQRKENPMNSSAVILSKNNSMKSKGKWKL